MAPAMFRPRMRPRPKRMTPPSTIESRITVAPVFTVSSPAFFPASTSFAVCSMTAANGRFCRGKELAVFLEGSPVLVIERLHPWDHSHSRPASRAAHVVPGPDAASARLHGATRPRSLGGLPQAQCLFAMRDLLVLLRCRVHLLPRGVDLHCAQLRRISASARADQERVEPARHRGLSLYDGVEGHRGGELVARHVVEPLPDAVGAHVPYGAHQ